MKPTEAVREKDPILQKPATPFHRLVGLDEKVLNSTNLVRYLLEPGEYAGGKRHKPFDGDVRRRATDAVWSIDVFNIEYSIVKPKQPVLYYLENAPTKRPFVREELLTVPPDTELPPLSILD